MLRKELQELSQKIEGRDLVIVGGGPSLSNFDFSRLEGVNTIAINAAYKYVPSPRIIYWADQNWIARNEKHVSRVDCYKLTSRISAERAIRDNIKSFADSIVLRKERDFGFSHDINSVCGNNSGAHTINIAANLKPSRIFLLGFDMGASDNRTHFHDEYSSPKTNIYENLFIPSIESMVPALEEIGMEVLNCSPVSKLHCFKKVNFNNYF